MASILIVEDDVDLNTAYRLILQRAGHDVESVYDGQQALEKLYSYIPDLIILDLLMPIKSGVEFLKEYRKRRDHQDKKILVFTNFDKGPEISEAMKLGADKVLIKAWTAPRGMIEVINNVLTQKPLAKT